MPVMGLVLKRTWCVCASLMPPSFPLAYLRNVGRSLPSTRQNGLDGGMSRLYSPCSRGLGRRSSSRAGCQQVRAIFGCRRRSIRVSADCINLVRNRLRRGHYVRECFAVAQEGVARLRWRRWRSSVHRRSTRGIPRYRIGGHEPDDPRAIAPHLWGERNRGVASDRDQITPPSAPGF